MNKNITGLFVFMILAFFGTSQLSSQVLMKAVLKDKNTGELLKGIEVDIRTSKKKRIKLKTNEITGEFEQLLQANEEYKIRFINDNIIKEYTTFKVKALADGESYSEEKFEFKATSVKPGMLIQKIALFDGDATELSTEGKKLLKKFKKEMKKNRAFYYDIVINSSSNAISSGRISALEDFTKKWKSYRKRLEFKAGSNGNETEIVINKIESAIKK